MTCRYSILIQWSDEDHKYIVTLPEFHNNHTHGATYEAALKNAQEVLELLIKTYQDEGWPLPQPKTFDTTVSAA